MPVVAGPATGSNEAAVRANRDQAGSNLAGVSAVFQRGTGVIKRLAIINICSAEAIGVTATLLGEMLRGSAVTRASAWAAATMRVGASRIIR